ncbi:MAG TPA: ABC transporter permease [Conexibacter sp.]|jgi:peptide/nickel transport system permease protein|nr:ABC transporter permease [Conexibacter sp.]
MTGQTITVPGGRLRRLTRRHGARWPGSLRVAVAILSGAALLALVGALALPDPNHQDLLAAFAKPGTGGHLLGADALGRDMLSGIAASIVTAAIVSVSVVVISGTIGVFAGILAGYRGGVIDAVVMRLVDLQLAIPPLLLFVAGAAVLGRDLLMVILLLCIPSWVPYARVVRSRVLVERERSSITAARLAGSSHLRIMRRNLLPATVKLVIVLGSLQMGWILLWESSLSFVSLGVQPPHLSFGVLISQGRNSLAQAWWVVVFPGIVLALLVLAANSLGDGLRDKLDVDAEILD